MWPSIQNLSVWPGDRLCQIYQDTQANWHMLLYLNMEIQIKRKTVCKCTFALILIKI